ncbi:MAG: divergent polysaccharide deacetylase family protein [Deltaproteobacteria bacterium]|nr:divergent polysaccharide deacetylase family protein [Deltaproteobacteria bacterium]
MAAAIGIVAFGGLLLWLRPRQLPPPSLSPPRMVTLAERAAAKAEAEAKASAGAVTAAPAAAARQGEAPAPRRAAPRVAVVIDDLGDSLHTARRVLALEPPVTVAVIPFRENSAAVAAAAVSNGREVILHLPLEPERDGAMAGGGGFLRTSMEPRHLEGQLERDLRAVPYIVGVNGHMGSRFTSDPRAMRTLLTALRARGLFFLDSKTSPESVAGELADGLGVPFAERNVFLDHDPSPDAVARALAVAARVARRTGQAIAIGHPHPSTLAALATWLPAATRDGFEIVPVSALVR